jgi:hypothetical protein
MARTYGWNSRNDGSSDGQSRDESRDTSEHVGELNGLEAAKVYENPLGLQGNF